MAYTKINWTEETALNSTNLQKMETQYDEVMNEIGGALADSSKPLRVEVVSTLPAASAGRLVYNTGNTRYMVSKTSTWEAFALPGQTEGVIG